MVARRAASHLPTVKLPQVRDKPTGRTLAGRGKPTGRQLRANGRLARVEALPEASGLPPPGTPLATELPVPVEPPQPARKLLPPGTRLPTGLPVPAEPPQPASEPQLPVRPPVAGLAAGEARVHSVGAPVDTTDPALAPPAAAVPPAWDLAEVAALAAEVAVAGADERAAACFWERLEARSGGGATEKHEINICQAKSF